MLGHAREISTFGDLGGFSVEKMANEHGWKKVNESILCSKTHSRVFSLRNFTVPCTSLKVSLFHFPFLPVVCKTIFTNFTRLKVRRLHNASRTFTSTTFLATHLKEEDRKSESKFYLISNFLFRVVQSNDKVEVGGEKWKATRWKKGRWKFMKFSPFSAKWSLISLARVEIMWKWLTIALEEDTYLLGEKL